LVFGFDGSLTIARTRIGLLFSRFSRIEEGDRQVLANFERCPLTFGPTAVDRLDRLAANLSGRVDDWAKHEDCNSGLAFGGVELRELEQIVPDALASRRQ
jgi:hypothetical protein